MKSANKVLGKKAVGIEALRRRDRDRQGGRNSSSNNSNYSGSSRPNISSPTASSSASTFSEHGASPLSGLRANSSSRPANSPARTSTNMPMASGPITIDLHRFASDNLQPQEIVRQLLGNASEEDIRGFHKSLVEAKQTVGGDLQRNVYRNYTEFVSISKEIANLDGDVMHLKMYLNDVRGIWQGFLTMADQADEGTSNEGTEVVLSARKPSDLMSTDLQGVYRSQLTSLWENVEGSQKFVKYAPGRHIIREFANFIEVDPQTGQPRQHVHIFLLNDCLLVAARKNRSMSTRYKLVAMYCWNVLDIRMMERTQSDVDGINIHVGTKTFAYRSERPEENVALFHSFTRLLDDNEINMMEQTANGAHFRDAGQPLNEPRQGPGKEVRLDEEDRLWLEQLPDELEVMIALRQFEEAVTCIGKARGILSAYSSNPPPFIRNTMDELAKYTDSLGATICSDLGNPLLTKLQFQRYVDWLLRLDKGEKAREVFLATRSLIIKKRIRQLIFEGDTTTYINELALVVYTLIRNTCEWYRDSFKQNAMSSGFVTWVREQTEIYAEIYKRQVFYQHQLSCQVISDCFKSTLDQCSMLRKVGLDLKFLLEDLFMENTKETVFSYEKKIGVKIDKFVHNDNFTTVSSQSLGPDVKVTSSVVSFYNLLVKFVNDVCLIAKLPLYTTVIDSVSRLTEHYLRSMLNESQKRDLSKDQRSAVLMNVSFVLDNVIPRVSSQFNYHFDRPIPELDSLRARLRELILSLSLSLILLHFHSLQPTTYTTLMTLIQQRYVYAVLIPSVLTLLLLTVLPSYVSATSAFWSNSTSPFISTLHHPHYSHALGDATRQWAWSFASHVARVWIAMECLFYLYYVASHSRLQAIKKPGQPLTLEQRTRLYWKCINAIDDIKSWGVGWFYYRCDMSHPTFEEIHRENLAVWFSWAFWHDHLSFVLSKDEWAQEMEWMIKTAEDKYNIKFTPGFNPDLQCIRLNLDPVLAVHRPLLFYLGIYLSTMLFNTLALQWGWQFEIYGDHSTVWGGVFYKLHQAFLWCTELMKQRQRRTASKPTTTVTTNKASADDAPHIKRIVYWYRSVEDSCTTDATTSSHAKTPLVFIHGIGAGLMCYVEFIYHLVGLDRPLFLVELPFVAMRMVDDVPDAVAVVDDIKAMLHHHGYEHGVFVSHSLGTAVTSWMMTNAPSVVAGTILIDPICFMLHYPQVCFNFIHKVPKRIVDYIMFYFASRELYISHYLSRHFQWFQCIYFADPVIHEDEPPSASPLNNATVFLSGADRIVGSSMVSKYLAKCGVDHRLMPGLEHAGFLFDWSWRKQILDQIDWVARNADDEGIDLRS